MLRKRTAAQNQRNYRKRHPEYETTEAMRVKARYRSMSELARRYPLVYQRLYDLELKKLKDER